MLQVWEVVAVLSLVPGFMGGLDGVGTAVYLMHASKGTSTGESNLMFSYSALASPCSSSSLF